MLPSELLDSPEKWCQGCGARDKDGNPVYPRSSDAQSWCLVGAIHRCFEDDDARLGAVLALDATLTGKFKIMCPMVFFNDDPDTSFLQIQMVLKEAGL